MILSPNYHLKFNKENRKIAKISSSIFSISLKDYQDEIGLVSSIHEATVTFKECHISLADSIQRYNLIWQSNISCEAAWKKANDLGIAWIDYYLPLIPGRVPKIIKWDYWLNHPKFYEKKELIELQYKNDINFRNSIEFAVNEYLNRYSKKYPINNEKIAQQFSTELIKEEITVLALQADLGYDFEIFFEIRNTGLKYFYENILWPKNPFLLKPVLAKINLP